MLELRDPYTAGHQRNVAALARAISKRIGLSGNETEGIALAASLHDIGKVNIPLMIASKPGTLTSLEMELIKTHARCGYEVLEGIDFPWPIAEMVLQHHEREDGSGYPQGLRRVQTLLGAKIIAVSDVLEAMLTHRPYRASRGIEAAKAELEHGRGALYLPAAVDASVALIDDGTVAALLRLGAEAVLPKLEPVNVNWSEPHRLDHSAPSN